MVLALCRGDLRGAFILQRVSFPSFVLFVFLFRSSTLRRRASSIDAIILRAAPYAYNRVYRRKYLGVMVAGTWLGAFGSLIPTWRGKWGQFGLDREIGSCSILPDAARKYSSQFLSFLSTPLCPPMSTIMSVQRQFSTTT